MTTREPKDFWGQPIDRTRSRADDWRPPYARRTDQGRAEARRRYPNTTDDRKA